MIALITPGTASATGETVVVSPPYTDTQLRAWRSVPPATPRTADVLVLGGGMSGVAAAVAAARRGVDVILVEPTHLLGGQAGPAGVSAMDVNPSYRLAQGYGIWGEFVRHISWKYRFVFFRPLNVCHYRDDSICPNVVVVDRVLEEMTRAARVRVLRNTALWDIRRAGGAVVGAVTSAGPIDARVTIDATEDGEPLALGSIPFRVSDGTSESAGDSVTQCIQDITQSAVIRRYPEGVPPELIIPAPPPDYDRHLPLFRTVYPPDGVEDPVLHKPGPTGFAGYRAAPDLASPAWHIGSEWQLVTRTTLNFYNDSPADKWFLLDRAARERELRTARSKTLGLIYYLQHVLGLPWSVATDEGYGLGPPTDAEPIVPGDAAVERHLPPRPYIRESLRLIGADTLTGRQIMRPANHAEAPWRADAVAGGLYPVDLHGCRGPDTFEERLFETGVDKPEQWREGPFPIPLGALIPRAADGFIAAEKNISQSRIASAAMRVHPSVTAVGQAAGTLAALAVRNGVEPRAVPAAAVQVGLLRDGALTTPLRIGGVAAGDEDYPAMAAAITRGRVPYAIVRPSGGEPYIDVDRSQAAEEGKWTLAAVAAWLD